MSERTRLLWISALSLVGGAVVGLTATFLHQGVYYVGTVPLPWGLVLSLALSAAYLIGLRLRFESRWPVLAAAFAYIVVCGLALLKAPNGSVIVMGNLWGNIWALVPSILAVLIVAWPRIRRSSKSVAQ